MGDVALADGRYRDAAQAIAVGLGVGLVLAANVALLLTGGA